MRCPKCGSLSRVLRTSLDAMGVVRHRRCAVHTCGVDFHTIERVATRYEMAVSEIQNPATADRFLGPRDAVVHLRKRGVRIDTIKLQEYRRTGSPEGPPFTRTPDGCPHYRIADLDRWANAQKKKA